MVHLDFSHPFDWDPINKESVALPQAEMALATPTRVRELKTFDDFESLNRPGAIRGLGL